jgi:hypothetical protein
VLVVRGARAVDTHTSSASPAGNTSPATPRSSRPRRGRPRKRSGSHPPRSRSSRRSQRPTPAPPTSASTPTSLGYVPQKLATCTGRDHRRDHTASAHARRGRRCHPRAALAWLPRCATSLTEGRTPERTPARTLACCQDRLLSRAPLGLGSGDRFQACRGTSGTFKEGVLQARKPGELQGKRAIKRLSAPHSSSSNPPW